MKRAATLFSVLCLTMALTIPANAQAYSFSAPAGPEFGKPTSVEPVATADRGETPNVDVSKDAAFVPPAFGSASAYVLSTGTPLVPTLAVEGTVMSGGTGAATMPAVGYTEVTSDLYYSGGYLATLQIPRLNVKVKVYQGTGSSTLARGAGHFEDTSIWAGNCCIAGHNRGVNCYFGSIHTLSVGDIITLTTALGTRTYAVTSVNKISEMDHSLLAPTAENCITLFTCVADQPAYRWAVRAVEI